MHGWGVTRGMSDATHLSRTRLPVMHSYASVTSASSPLPPYTPPLSTPTSRSLPLQILLALFTTLVVLSSVLQVAGLHEGLRYVDDSGDASPTALYADPLSSDVLHGILPDVPTTSDSSARVEFTIAYNGKSVSDGAFVPMTEAAHAPTIAIRDGAARYTWMLVDIDAPDPADPSHAPFLHYIVEDLDAAEPAQQQAQRGHVVVPYFPVTPPVGKHRYVSLLFRQPEAPVAALGPAESEQLARLSVQRANFNVAAFAKDHALVFVGSAHFVSQPTADDEQELENEEDA